MISILETELINALSVRKVNKSDDWIKAKNQYFQETDSFRKKFTTKKIANLSLHDYAPGNKNKNSFCFHIERGLKVSGSISGSPINRFGVYYSNKEQAYKATKYLGGDVKKGLDKLKTVILALISLKKPISIQHFNATPLSNMFKNKILHVYHPEDYLSIYSKEHLFWLCDQLKISYESLNHYHAHQALLNFKRKHHEFSALSNWEFGRLIYTTCQPQSRL